MTKVEKELTSLLNRYGVSPSVANDLIKNILKNFKIII